MLSVRSYAAGEAIRLEEVPVPEPTGAEVRLAVVGCGVCRTDLHIINSDLVRVRRPITLGHEIAGRIDAVGEGAADSMAQAGLAVGDHVLVAGGWGCGSCERCLTGDEQACALRESPGLKRDGGFAEYLLVPHPRHLVPLGEGLDPSHCAPLADAGLTPWRAITRARPWLDRGRALVIGSGGLGQFAVQYLRRLGDLEVLVADVDPAKRQRAIDLGADAAVDLRDGGGEALAGTVPVVFDFVGTDETLRQAALLVARGGLVSLVGEAGGRLSFGFRQLAVEASVTTTSWGTKRELEEVVELAHAGAMRWETELLPLTRAGEALERLASGDVSGRLVLVP